MYCKQEKELVCVNSSQPSTGVVVSVRWSALNVRNHITSHPSVVVVEPAGGREWAHVWHMTTFKNCHAG